MRLTFEVDPGTLLPTDHELGRLHVYESSVSHATTGEPLVSVATRGRGLRLTKTQAVQLHEWLGKWLANAAK